MAEISAISWTQATWNPFYGCHKTSPGCAKCYMTRWANRAGHDPDTVKRAAPSTFNAPLRWREPRLVFTCSLSDFFIEEADPWRPEVWDIIRRTPHLTYQILTKRPGRIADHLPPDWGDGWPNCWLGVSVENLRHRHRVGELLEVSAAVYFVSAEPLLGNLSLDGYLRRQGAAAMLPGINWLIAGGESGPGHRPMDLDWARTLRDECQRNGVPFFLKQLGGWPNQRADHLAVLDGRTWTEMPETRAGQLSLFG